MIESIISFDTEYRIQGTDYEKQITKYWIIGHRIQITSGQRLQDTGYRIQDTGCRIQITGYG